MAQRRSLCSVATRPWIALDRSEGTVGEWLEVDVSAAAADTDIHVDARYGTYDPDTGTVVGLG